jgi:ABC-2 type transport system permease protein
MGKYTKLLSNFTAVSLTYRSNILGSIISEGIFTSSVIVLWISIFRTNTTVGGLQLSDALLYFLFVPFFGYLTKTNQASKISKDIKTGDVSNQLIKPYKIFISNLTETIGFKFNYFVFIIPLYVILLITFFLNFPTVQLTPLNIAITTLFAVLAFFLNFIAELAIAYAAFWMDEIWSLDHIKTIFLWLFGGVTFPFELLSSQLRWWFELLPFKYTYYVPISYLIGKREVSQYLLTDLLSITVWTAIFALITATLWKRGIKRYGAYGN